MTSIANKSDRHFAKQVFAFEKHIIFMHKYNNNGYPCISDFFILLRPKIDRKY